MTSDEAVVAGDDEQLCDLFWLAVQDAGHIDCGGWRYDTLDPWTVTCYCGTDITLAVSL